MERGPNQVIDDRAKVIAYLKRRGIRYAAPTQHQIKVDDFNFYPSTGTIIRDGMPKNSEVGGDAFVAILKLKYPNQTEVDPLDC